MLLDRKRTTRTETDLGPRSVTGRYPPLSRSLLATKSGDEQQRTRNDQHGDERHHQRVLHDAGALTPLAVPTLNGRPRAAHPSPTSKDWLSPHRENLEKATFHWMHRGESALGSHRHD